jgi:hypothetical protein
MTESSEPTPRPKHSFVELLYLTIIPKVEIIALLVILAGMGFWLSGMHQFETPLTLGLQTLAIIFFLYAFQPPPVESREPRLLLLNKLIYICGSVACLGILFHLMQWEGNLLLVGAPSLFISSILFLYVLVTKPQARQIAKVALLRTGMITFFSSYLFLQSYL